jgi:hypothetical protein
MTYLFLFAEKDFLTFFFKRLKMNNTNRYREDFPYLSLCGRERNFVRCDDQPIVYTHIIPSESEKNDRLSYGGAGAEMTVEFEPEKICMLPRHDSLSINSINSLVNSYLLFFQLKCVGGFCSLFSNSKYLLSSIATELK